MKPLSMTNAWGAAAGDWWNKRAPRERLLLMVAAALSVLVLLVFGVWRPLQSARSEARAQIETYERLALQIRAAGPEGVRRAMASDTPATAVLSDAAAAQGLTLRRVDPDGERTRASLEDVDFVKLLGWLERVQRDGGLRLVEVKLERRPAPGFVNAEVTVAEN